MKKIVAIIAIAVSCVALFICSVMSIIKSNAEELDSVTSRELLDQVLDYDAITDVYLYNVPEDSIDAIKKECSALSELQNRDDYIQTVIDKYEEYELSKEFTVDEDVFQSLAVTDIETIDSTITGLLEQDGVEEAVEDDVREYAQVYLLECLITSTNLIEESSTSQIEEIKSVIYDKYLEKEESEVYIGLEEDAYKIADISETSDDLGVKINTRDGYDYITTPRGTKVEVYVEDYNGDKWANMVTMEMKKEYPNAKVLAKADNRYNCHSYAWYRSDTSNRYWLNDPTAFITDGSYIRTNNLSKYDKVTWAEQRGSKVTYVEHSGVVLGQKGKNVVIVSKWGQGPLMQHTDTYSPYSYPVIYFTKNK